MLLACSKAESHFLLRVRTLGKDVSNYAALHQTSFVRLTPIFHLMRKHYPKMAANVQLYYLLYAQHHYDGQYRRALRKFKINKLIPLAPTPLVGEVREEWGMASLAEGFKNLFSSSTEATLGMTSANRSSFVFRGDVPPSELVTSMAALIESVHDMINAEDAFCNLFFKLEADRKKTFIGKIFGKITASLHRRLQQRLFLAGNLSEVIRLYAQVAVISNKNKTNDSLQADGDFLQTIIAGLAEYVAGRIEILVINQVKSLDASLNNPNGLSSSPAISLITRRYFQFLVDLISDLGAVPIESSLLQKQYFPKKTFIHPPMF